MKDVQNRRGDYLFDIDKVGVKNLVQPLRLKSKEGKLISTVGNFSLGVDLAKDIKGINMSRLPQLLANLEEEGFVFEDIKRDTLKVLKDIKEKVGANNSYLEVEFNYFLSKKAPVSDYKGIMPYRCEIKSALKEEYEFDLSIEVPVTTLCPCSKEISSYSAHNQRGYVKVSLNFNEKLWIEDIIKLVEFQGSCEIYPVLKRVDEKYVTEKAYDNPRFVEDMVRYVGESLLSDKRIESFSVESRHQESIHSHDAYALLEKKKDRKKS
ncbi:GTP cyclohydrolase FolE2 [Halonatronum saccharophilum]|uniref:GTP cyclohydrolase FolE2 n=1 Tax=Halonatronum saccharophilum TaxID=150060 RepID=UPI000482E1EE|nr:GTP cyclohydrolase FolE2 [Halonatronum saccharophilum]